MDLREEKRLVRKTIEFPVKHENKQQTIWDSKSIMVCDINNWKKNSVYE